MKKKKWLIVFSILIAIVLQSGTIPVLASSSSTTATVVGASGDQSSSDEGTALIATSTKGDTKGSNVQAAFVSSVTATGTSSNTGSSLGSARVGYLHFDIADGTEADDVGKAVVTINVTGTHGNLNGYKTKAGLYRVTAAPSSVTTTDAATYPAKGNDYSQSATAYCKEWIAADNLGAKTFDVTDMVKAAIKDGDDGISFRLQTVLSAFYFSTAGENIPTLRIDKAVKKIAGASGNQSTSPTGTVLISTSTKGDTAGSDVQAAYEADVTATGMSAAAGGNLASARVGYLNFPIDNTMAPGAVGKATVSIYVTDVHGNIGVAKTKAGLYCVDTSWEDVTVSDASTYKAKNEDYSKEATIYSNEWIAKNETGVKTFDVTDVVKDALTDGKGYISFRLQTVLSGFYMAAEGENAPSIQITNSAATDPIESLYDFYESIYQVSSSDTGKSIAYDGNLKVNADDTEGTVQVIRYGELDETDDLNNIPVALQTSADGKYFTLSKGSAAGTAVTLAASAAADRTQQFILKKSQSWSKDHLAYKIYHPISRMYLGYSAASPYTLQAYGKTAPEYDFVFSRTDYTVLGKVRTTAGYGTLTDAQKKRVFDTLGGVGVNSLGSYAKNGVTALQSVYENYTAKEADAQAADILTIIGGNAFGVSAGSLSALPGTSSVQTKILAQEEGNYDFWRGTKLDGTKYTLQITDSYATQTIDVYVHDNATAITNGKNAMEAIKQIPYPLRKNIKIMKIRNDSANSYNCGANDFYMRVNWTPTKDNIA